jgi:hypothetical protein
MYMKLIFKDHKHLILLICEMCRRLKEEQRATMRLILTIHMNTKQACENVLPTPPPQRKPAAQK